LFLFSNYLSLFKLKIYICTLKLSRTPKIWVATCNNKQGAEIDKPFPEKMLKSSLFSESVLIKIIKKLD